MTRKHFEYMAATIASDSTLGTERRLGMLALAVSAAGKFGERFDVDRFAARIAQYDSGERNPITYLNAH